MGKPLSEEQKRHLSEKLKLYWDKRKAQAQGYQQSPIVGVTPRSTREQLRQEAKPVEALPVTVTVSESADPWESLPFAQALDKLTGLQKEVTHAHAVLSRRSASLPKVWTCWTALNRKSQANLPGMTSAYAQCAKSVPDGKWVSKDDCVINKDTGMVDPVVVCSNTCYALYQTYRSRLRLAERTQPDAEQSA